MLSVGVLVFITVYIYFRKVEGISIVLIPKLKGQSLVERKIEAERIVNFYTTLTITFISSIVAYFMLTFNSVNNLGRYGDIIGVFLIYRSILNYVISRVRIDAYKGITESGLKDSRVLIDIETEYEESKYTTPLMIFLGVVIILIPIWVN